MQAQCAVTPTALEPSPGRWERYPIAALSTNEHGFYTRLGWERWRGPAYVVSGSGWVRAEDEDDGIMVLRTPACPVADLTMSIAVDERSGDDW